MCVPDRIGIWKCWILGERKTGVPGEKPLGAKDTYGVDAGIRTHVTLVEGECYHRYATLSPPAPPLLRVVACCWELLCKV